MAKTYFITGTDTEVGKTFATELLLKALGAAGWDVLGLKPIASDSQWQELAGQKRLLNGDALIIYQANEQKLDYSQVNPLVYEEAIAPHIAAERAGQGLSVELLQQKVSLPNCNTLLIEGAGGWLTPLNQSETYADWVIANGMEVVLVVGMKLGCLNHAQLTAQQIAASGLKLSGWIANQIQPDMPYYQENLDWLKLNLEAPMLAEVKYQDTLDNFTKNNSQMFELLDH